MDLYSYVLDSLVFMSEHIVRGRLAARDDVGVVPADAIVYMPIPSGLKVIVENKVLGFA